jgi:hypothetical protein
MALIVANLVVIVGLAYILLGVFFAVAFAFRGISVVDHSASNSPWTFRLLMIPGVALLWPWMLGRWVRAVKKERP